jgi:hypothetical protein
MKEKKEVSDFTLKVKRSTAKRFKKLGTVADSTDTVLVMLLDFWEENHKED